MINILWYYIAICSSNIVIYRNTLLAYSYSSINLILFVGDRAHVILFVRLYHMLSCHSIGQLNTIS